MGNFESKLNIGDSVTFRPMFIQSKKLGISSDDLWGTVVAIRFTKAKVFYDILDDYYSKVFTDVDSANVFEIEMLKLEE
jgi:hypothetical protein